MVFVSLVASETGSSTAPHKEAAGARTPAAFGFFLYTPTIDIEPKITAKKPCRFL